MKRLVYSPSIKAWVKTDSGIVDLSPYIVNCNIQRKIDDVSSAELEFRNPKVKDENGKLRFLFTEHAVGDQILPVFHPMDPITIILERISGKPIQVFTGYCDTVPDVQLFPGTAKIKASCTLKRLLYTYWDPALPFVVDFMKAYGWNLDRSTGKTGQPLGKENKNVSKTNNLNDSSIGNLLYAVLHEIGGWNDSNIYIQPLPANIGSTVSKLMDEFTEDNKRANQEVADLMSRIVGTGTYGNASAGGGVMAGSGGATLSGPVANEGQIIRTIRERALKVAGSSGIASDLVVLAVGVAIVETGLGSAVDSRQKYGAGQNDWYQWTVTADGQPYCNNPAVDLSKGYDLGYSTEMFCRAAMARKQARPKGLAAWARVTQLCPCVYGVCVDDQNYYGNSLYGDGPFASTIADARRLLAKYP